MLDGKHHIKLGTLRLFSLVHANYAHLHLHARTLHLAHTRASSPTTQACCAAHAAHVL